MSLSADFSPPSLTRTVVKSPLGPLGLVARGEHLAAVFLKVDPAWFPFQVERTYGSVGREAMAPFTEVKQQLEEYFAGHRLVFRLPLDMEQGTPFQRRVWNALRDIPYGQTVTYKEIAQSIGQPSAVRAVGGANGANPIPIIVPCHRVVGSGGRLGGYAYGLDVKTQLLEHETRTRMRAASLGMFEEDGPEARFRFR